MISILLAAAIQLVGVIGNDLRARAFFDANNVKVGDPMILTIDFLGSADFKALHPPALAKLVDRKSWKVDDVSAKTDTFRDARRLTYRVRPMREGVLWFPELEFAYRNAEGEELLVKSNRIPVHARVGAQVVVEEMGEDHNEMPAPPELVRDFHSNEDEEFAWRRACANPTADAFVAFNCPAARMNEARCAILEGNWARAMKIYSRLEWQIGQTKEMERGIVAALALRYENPMVELPVWRQVLRPILRHNWKGRVAIVLGSVAAIALLLWLLGRGIRAMACLLILISLPCGAQDIFKHMEEQMQRMRQQMNQMMQGSMSFTVNGQEQEPPEVIASLAMSKQNPQVGEGFDFILSLETLRSASIGQVRITPSERFGMTITGSVRNLPDEKSGNPTNVIKRLAIPVRYDVPFDGKIAFAVEGMVSGKQERNRSGGGFFSSFSFSTSFRCDTEPLSVRIRPLPSANQPEDFSGIVSEGLRLHETLDLIKVGTNDVITITYKMFPKGYVPATFLPPGAAFEWSRSTDDNDRPLEISYRGYFVADGVDKTPIISVCYYDPRKKVYKRVSAGGTKIVYVAVP